MGLSESAIEPDRIPEARVTRRARVSDIPRITPASEAGPSNLEQLTDLALDTTGEFQPERVPRMRGRPDRLRRLIRGDDPVRTIEFDPTPDQLLTPEELAEGDIQPTIRNPFQDEDELEREVIRLANKKIRRGRPMISKRDAEEIYRRLASRGVTREQVFDILTQNDLIDMDFELNLETAPRPERGFIRRMRAVRYMRMEDQEIELEGAPMADTFVQPDEEGFTEITPRQLGLRRRYGTLPTADQDTELMRAEEGRFTNQNNIDLNTDENRYSVRIRNRGLSDSVRANTIRLRAQVQEAGRKLAQASDSIGEMSRNLGTETNQRLRSLRQNVSAKYRAGYANILEATSRLSQDELEDLRNQLKVLPPDADLSTRGVTIPDNMVLTDDPQVDIESGLVRPQLEEGLDFSPFEEVTDTTIGTSERPSLSFRQRLRVAGQSFKDIPGQPVGETFAGAGAGMLGAFGLSTLLSKAGVNPYANAAASGAFGDTTGRVSAMIGNQIYSRLTSAGTEAIGDAVAETAGQVALRAGTSLLRGGLEGAGIGLATMPLDILLNNALVNSGMSHAGANVVSGTTVGLGTTAVIGGISLAAAPETLGMSLLVGGLATGVSALVGFYTGKAEDDKIRNARNNYNNKTTAREELINTLPNYNYNFATALQAMKSNNPTDYNKLQVTSSDFKTFQTNMNTIFRARPGTINPPDVPPATGDKKRVNDLFGQATMHELIDNVCSRPGAGDCADLRKKDPGALSKSDTDFLNKQTNSTWGTSVNLLVAQTVNEMNYTQVRTRNAQQYLLDQWNNNKIPAKNLDKYYSDTAFVDTKFQTEYMKNIKIDAQQEVVNAYYFNQTKLQDMDPNIQYAANLDPAFAGTMNNFYSAMEQGATNLQISVAQLIQLQGTDLDKQQRLYEGMQFDRIKGQPDVVSDAQDLAQEQDRVRRAGYYDIDAGFLDTADPTSISSWHPTDSQILQANSAGMNLSEYVVYIHQLALGQAGNFALVPTYTPSVELSLKQTDFRHFQDELQMAGYSPNLYVFNTTTGNITINPNAPQIPNLEEANSFISQFEPAYVTQARHEYSDMVHNLNQANQQDVDDYNADVRRQLSVFGNNYDEMVEGQNNYIARTALTATPLLVFNQADYLNQYLIDYNPISATFPKGGTTPTGGGITTKGGGAFAPVSTGDEGEEGDEDIDVSAKEQAEIAAARARGLTLDQYLREKQDVQEAKDEGADADDELIQTIEGRIKGGNLKITDGDVTTITTSTGEIIKQTKGGEDVTDEVDPSLLANPLPRVTHKPENHGLDPTDVLNTASAQSSQQTQPSTQPTTQPTRQPTTRQPPRTEGPSKGNK